MFGSVCGATVCCTMSDRLADDVVHLTDSQKTSATGADVTWQPDPRPVLPELEPDYQHAVDVLSPAEAHGWRVIDRLPREVREQLEQHLVRSVN